ncbi:MAG TPA: PAS domain-containing protein, partial [Terrimicrobiaceae bacterium]|nr:PAS domain-containing protein [Terrimicrobiaceae bacterium]
MGSPKGSLAVPLAAVAVATAATLLAKFLFEGGQMISGLLVVIALVAGGAAGLLALRTLRQTRHELDHAIHVARHDLHKIEHILEMAGRMSKMGAWSVEFPDQRILWSEEVYRIHEVPANFDPNLTSALDFFPPASRAQIEAAFQECAEHGTPYDLELAFLTGKGRRLWIRTIGEAEYEDGSLKRIIGTFQDITEERNAAEELKQSREFLQLALSSAEMSISDWHIPSGRILFDENWARILGYRLSEVQQTLAFWDSLIPDEDQPAIMEAQNRCFSGIAQLFDVIYRMRGKNGEYHWVLERSKIVERDAEGNPIRLSGILLDVTARKQIEDELREAKARLEQTVHTEKELTRTARAAERAKSEFLAVMSHEIRTPMNGVLGFADLLAQTTLDGNQRDFIHTIQRSGTALLRIIDDILDYSRLEAGRLKIEDAAFSLRQLLENVEGLMSPAAHQKGVRLEIKIAENIPDRLIGASDRIQQVLVNLTGNAIKFTPTHGNVVIGCRESGHGVYNFSVRDTGIGVPESQIAQI